MAFSDETIKTSWRWAGGAYPPSPCACECRRVTHAHGVNRCYEKLTWENRGKAVQGGWEAHSISGHYIDSSSDCEIICWSCYKALSETNR